MLFLSRIVNFLDATTRVLSVGIVVAILSVMLAQVFARYVLNNSIIWSEEGSVYLLGWLVFFGAAVVMRRWEHISILTFIGLLPIRVRSLVLMFGKLLTLVFFAYVLIYGIEVFNAKFHTVSGTMNISSKWAKLAVPVGASIILVYILDVFLADLRAFLAGRFEHFEKQGSATLD